MGGCRCTFRTCTNNSANSPGLHFFTFPLKDTERCQKWVMYSDNPSFLEMPALKLRNKVVCEKHFRDVCFMNYKKERLVSTAIPTLFPLPSGYVLDYEESSSPEPKMLEPTTQKHLIPPEDYQPNKEFDEEQFSIMEEQHHVANQETYIIEELGDPDQSEVEIVDAFDECVVYGGHRQKIRKLEESASSSQSHLPKVLNRVIVSRKVPVKMKNFTSVHGSAVTVPPNTTDVGRQVSVSGTSESEDLQNIEIDLQSNQELSNKKIDRSKGGKVVSISTSPATEPVNRALEIVTMFDSDGCQNPTELKTIDATPPDEGNVQQSITQDIKSQNLEDNYVEKSKYLETIAEHEKQIKALEKRLLESEAKKILPKSGTQVETISTSRKTESLGTGGITKQQLFSGIKKYLTPSMVSIVRMEMFGGPDREWKSDEKAVAVELLQLGSHVFDYVRDEWRFRLPPKKDVEKWQKEYSNVSEEDDF